MAKNTCQLGKIALKINKHAAKNKAQTIIILRPKRSEINPVKSSPVAKAMVEKDKGKLLSVGETAKNFAKIGIIGCTQYSDENEANPAKNKAHKIAKKDFEPYATLPNVGLESDIKTPHTKSVYADLELDNCYY